MSKSKKVGILLIIIGVFIPSVLYPFATLTISATLIKIAFATRGAQYEQRLSDLEVVFKKGYGIAGYSEGKIAVPEGRIAVPYRYIVAFGITIAFVGISFVALSRKKKDIK